MYGQTLLQRSIGQESLDGNQAWFGEKYFDDKLSKSQLKNGNAYAASHCRWVCAAL